ncbi:MAG TPA: YqaE/Pmp3 family membrane protein [Chitinophagaceae bacterium]|nr:YqaE/Pmp3 family membrane protein [Chitinophagaceae bacterium]
MKQTFTQLLVVLFTISLLATPAATIAMTTPSSASSATSEPDPATVKAALKEFKSLSKKERKARVKEAKKAIKHFKADKRAGKAPEDNTVLLVILAILLPPLAVYLHQGEVNTKFWISLLLTLLFWLPGVVYALIVILGDE